MKVEDAITMVDVYAIDPRTPIDSELLDAWDVLTCDREAGFDKGDLAELAGLVWQMVRDAYAPAALHETILADGDGELLITGQRGGVLYRGTGGERLGRLARALAAREEGAP